MDIMKLLYHSLINSKLQYGIIVWGATFKTYLSEVNVRINRIIRALSSSNLYTPMSSLYKKLNLQKLEDLYKVELGKFMYLYFNIKHQKFLTVFLKKLQKFTLTIQDKYLTLRFFLPRMSKTCTQTSISYKSTKIWSKLKPELKNLHWNAFKKQFKKSFIDQY